MKNYCQLGPKQTEQTLRLSRHHKMQKIWIIARMQAAASKQIALLFPGEKVILSLHLPHFQQIQISWVEKKIKKRTKQESKNNSKICWLITNLHRCNWKDIHAIPQKESASAQKQTKYGNRQRKLTVLK